MVQSPPASGRYWKRCFAVSSRASWVQTGLRSSDPGRLSGIFSGAAGNRSTDFAVFEALHEHHLEASTAVLLAAAGRRQCAIRGRRRWPSFAAAHRDRVEFFEFLQWEADRQLAAAAAAGREAGVVDRALS